MAGTQEKEKAAGIWRSLLEGYDSLTLDPSPSLRRTREALSRTPESGMESAWKTVGRALVQAMRSVSSTFGPRR